MLKDLKEGRRSGRKPDITHTRYGTMVYGARSCEYGNDKYERSNYARATGDGPHTTPTCADVERFREYLRATLSHTMQTLDALERHQANDPAFADVAGMRIAAYAIDTDETPDNPVGPSLLPHVAACVASLNMAIEQARMCGLLPLDPGQPWRSPELHEAKYADGAVLAIINGGTTVTVREAPYRAGAVAPVPELAPAPSAVDSALAVLDGLASGFELPDAAVTPTDDQTARFKKFPVKHFGSTLDSFLEEEGIKEEVDKRALEKIAAHQARTEVLPFKTGGVVTTAEFLGLTKETT